MDVYEVQRAFPGLPLPSTTQVSQAPGSRRARLQRCGGHATPHLVRDGAPTGEAPVRRPSATAGTVDHTSFF